MSTWMPGAVQRPQPGGVTLDTSLPPRGIWHITWDALNASGGQPDIEAVANYLISKEWCPHILWNPFTGYMEQYYPANVGARALTFNDQDGAACIQVEIFFTPGCVVDGVKYDTVADTPLKGWPELLDWMDSLGIPRQWPMGAPQWQGNSRDADIWNGNGGHYGHCHSPGDTHTDPGPMPALTGGTISTQSTTISPVQEDDIMATIEELTALLDSRVDELTKRTNAQHVETRAQSVAQHIASRDVVIKGTQAQQDVTRGYLLDSIPAAVLNKSFKLADGTVTNLAGILTAIHAQPATVTNVTSAAPAPIDVDALVARLKAELPAAVLAELTTKLTK